MYWSVLVRTCAYQYIHSMPVRTGTYRYVLGRRHVIISYTQAVSDLRVKFNSVHVLCKRYDIMESNFKKCKVQACMYILVRTGTYWYVLVRTWKQTCDYLIHPGSDLRVEFNSVHVLCKRYDMMESNFKK